MVGARVARCVHQLNHEIDAFRRRIGALGGHDVLFAQDGDLSFDQEAPPLVVIGDHALADDNSFAWLEFDLQGHGSLPV